MRLKGKNAIITGGASGFGLAATKLFINEGAQVAILDINEKAAIDAMDSFSDTKSQLCFFKADVSDEDSVRQGFGQVAEAWNEEVDILINCAGFGRSETIQSLTITQWRHLIDVNLTGTFLCCREVIPLMIKRQYGKIINLASICAQTARMVAVDYSAAKSGIVGITRALALQVAPEGINVNAIAPGPIVTPLFEKNYTEEQMENLMKTIPFKRRGTTMDIANLMLFLSSDESGWITGETIAINGGAFIG